MLGHNLGPGDEPTVAEIYAISVYKIISSYSLEMVHYILSLPEIRHVMWTWFVPVTSK